MTTIRVAVLIGDGIGPEVTTEAVKVLEATCKDFEFIVRDVGGEEYLRSNDAFSPEALSAVEEADATLLGTLGHESVPAEITRKVLVHLRIQKDAYANVRPMKSYSRALVSWKQHPCPEVDIVIVRDNAEGFSLDHKRGGYQAQLPRTAG